MASRRRAESTGRAILSASPSTWTVACGGRISRLDRRRAYAAGRVHFGGIVRLTSDGWPLSVQWPHPPGKDDIDSGTALAASLADRQAGFRNDSGPSAVRGPHFLGMAHDRGHPLCALVSSVAAHRGAAIVRLRSSRSRVLRDARPADRRRLPGLLLHRRRLAPPYPPRRAATRHLSRSRERR